MNGGPFLPGDGVAYEGRMADETKQAATASDGSDPGVVPARTPGGAVPPSSPPAASRALPEIVPRLVTPSLFVAIDFEMSGRAPHAICSVGMVRVRDGRPEATFYSLVRPPSPRVGRTEIHGLTWEMLKDAPTLPEVWPRMREFCRGAQGFVAHDALHEFRAIRGSCRRFKLAWTHAPFFCTYRGATRWLPQAGCSLDKLCAYMGIGLDHHNALSDALGCAQVFMRLQALGASPWSMCLGDDLPLPRRARSRRQARGEAQGQPRHSAARPRGERTRKKGPGQPAEERAARAAAQPVGQPGGQSAGQPAGRQQGSRGIPAKKVPQQTRHRPKDRASGSQQKQAEPSQAGQRQGQAVPQKKGAPRKKRQDSR